MTPNEYRITTNTPCTSYLGSDSGKGAYTKGVQVVWSSQHALGGLAPYLEVSPLIWTIVNSSTNYLNAILVILTNMTQTPQLHRIAEPKTHQSDHQCKRSFITTTAAHPSQHVVLMPCAHQGHLTLVLTTPLTPKHGSLTTSSGFDMHS